MANIIFCLGLGAFGNMSLVLITSFILKAGLLAIAISPLTIGMGMLCGLVWGATLNYLQKECDVISIASHPRWRWHYV
jgi:hypothetical protein